MQHNKITENPGEFQRFTEGYNYIPVDFSLRRERGNELDKAQDKRNRARRKARQA